MGQEEQELVADPGFGTQLPSPGCQGTDCSSVGCEAAQILLKEALEWKPTPDQSKTTNLCLWREHPTAVTYRGGATRSTAACRIPPGIFLFYRLLARVRRQEFKVGQIS